MFVCDIILGVGRGSEGRPCSTDGVPKCMELGRHSNPVAVVSGLCVDLIVFLWMKVQ